MGRMSKQIPFDFDDQPSFDRVNFLETDSHAAALALLSTPDTWPDGKLMVLGPTGSGKSHMLAMQADAWNVPILSGATLDATRSPAEIVIVDDAQLVAGHAEETLFHLHNTTLAAGRKLLLAAEKPPSQWGLSLPDLVSRLQATTAVEIDEPDDTLLTALLVKQMGDYGVAPKPGVVPYLAKNMDRSFAAVRDLVDRMERISRAERQPATLKLAQRALTDQRAAMAGDETDGQIS